MNKEEIERALWELIDEHSMDISQEEYLDLLQSIRDDANIRAESVEQEIEEASENE